MNATMTATPDAPREPVSYPIRARNDQAALKCLLQETGARLPNDLDAIEELLREVASIPSPNPWR